MCILPLKREFHIQTVKEVNKEDPYLCLSDFVAPLDSGKEDFIGLFACSIFGADELSEK